MRRCFSTRLASAARLPAATQPIVKLTPSLHRLKLASDRFVLPPTTTVEDAARHLLDERLTFALIGDGKERGEAGISGMLTERDILRYATHADTQAFFSGGRQQVVSDWMTPKSEMLSVRLEDTLETAAGLLQRGIWRHLPVLDHWGKLHSILDIRDVLATIFSPEHGAEAWRGGVAADVLGAKRRAKVLGAQQKSADGWRRELETYLLRSSWRHCVAEGASIERAGEQMARERLTFLVVVQQVPHSEASGGPSSSGLGQRVVGLVSERSFLAFAAAREQARAPDLASKQSSAPVSTIMVPLSEVEHVSFSSPVSEVSELFFEKNVRHVPVIDDEKLLGIISMRDLLRPLLSAS